MEQVIMSGPASHISSVFVNMTVGPVHLDECEIRKMCENAVIRHRQAPEAVMVFPHSLHSSQYPVHS